jgi:hypothetical protein
MAVGLVDFRWRICWVAYGLSKSSDDERRQAQKQEQGVSSFIESRAPVGVNADFVCIYGYEEMAAPGGSLMVGQWCDPRADRDCFIFWCT